MHVLPSIGSVPCVGLVCCMHGDERFGLTVFEALRKDFEQRKDTMLILANEEALARDVRFLESDLNRSFPGKQNGTFEERLAYALCPLLHAPKYFLDIHTTTSDIRLTPIVTNLDQGTRDILALTDSSEIVIVNQAAADHALIGQVMHGVSLEFGEAYAKTPAAFADILHIIDGLRSQIVTSVKKRRVFYLDGIIPKSAVLSADARNFQYIPELDAYPFLLHERAYAATAHALKATTVEEMMI